jgi:diaminohydroxyphosphoribosylaminopyrimidine deaminase / 5-amino-6-(5-phosphoribosylamino)uracil reductase
MPDDITALDERFTAAAIRLGAGALGTTWPNPAVGAIVVRDGIVVARGRTGGGGTPHGETLALAAAGEVARGATLYVSLEPCAHHGRTPPCSEAVCAAGIARVVAPIEDADPRVAGRGFAGLREAGIAVATGACAAMARRAHAGHLMRAKAGRPRIVLKLAVSADGGIGRQGEGQVAVTGPIARRHVQALRSRFDAILVGRGTVEADDPELTCRLPGLEARSPVRVVLAGEGRLPPTAKIFDPASPAPTWIVSAAADPQGLADGTRVRWLQVPAGDGGVDLARALSRLAEAGITRVLVEGGAAVAGALLAADLVDEAMLFRSPDALGDNRVAALGDMPLETITASARFRVTERRRFGRDRMTRYERVR